MRDAGLAEKYPLRTCHPERRFCARDLLRCSMCFHFTVSPKKKGGACNQYGNRLPSRRYETLMLMAKWKQYELWVQSGQNKWEIVGLFPGTELATVVANARAARTRLIEVTYDGSKMMGQEIIAELGTTRKE